MLLTNDDDEVSRSHRVSTAAAAASSASFESQLRYGQDRSPISSLSPSSYLHGKLNLSLLHFIERRMGRFTISAAIIILVVAATGIDGAFKQLGQSKFYYSSEDSDKGVYNDAETKCKADGGTASLTKDLVTELKSLCDSLKSSGQVGDFADKAFWYMDKESTAPDVTNPTAVCPDLTTSATGDCTFESRGCALSQHYICYRGEPVTAAPPATGTNAPTGTGTDAPPPATGTTAPSDSVSWLTSMSAMSSVIFCVIALLISNF